MTAKWRVTLKQKGFWWDTVLPLPLHLYSKKESWENEHIEQSEKKTKQNTQLHINIYFSYNLN